MVSGFEIYTKGQSPLEREWQNDGSKLIIEPVFADTQGGP